MRKRESRLGTVAIRSSLAGATPPSSTPPIGNLDPRSSVRPGEIQPLWSGRADLNRRPLDPQSSALTKLRHGPMLSTILPARGPPALRSPPPPSSPRSEDQPHGGAVEVEGASKDALDVPAVGSTGIPGTEEHEGGRPHPHLGTVADEACPARRGMRGGRILEDSVHLGGRDAPRPGPVHGEESRHQPPHSRTRECRGLHHRG